MQKLKNQIFSVVKTCSIFACIQLLVLVFPAHAQTDPAEDAPDQPPNVLFRADTRGPTTADNENGAPGILERGFQSWASVTGSVPDPYVFHHVRGDSIRTDTRNSPYISFTNRALVAAMNVALIEEYHRHNDRDGNYNIWLYAVQADSRFRSLEQTIESVLESDTQPPHVRDLALDLSIAFGSRRGNTGGGNQREWIADSTVPPENILWAQEFSVPIRGGYVRVDERVLLQTLRYGELNPDVRASPDNFTQLLPPEPESFHHLMFSFGPEIFGNPEMFLPDQACGPSTSKSVSMNAIENEPCVGFMNITQAEWTSRIRYLESTLPASLLLLFGN